MLSQENLHEALTVVEANQAKKSQVQVNQIPANGQQCSRQLKKQSNSLG